MRVVVFGAGGFVGSALAKSIQDSGNEVLGVDRIFVFEVSFPNRTVDITESPLEPLLEPGDVVVHLAANPLGASMKEPLANAQVNIIGTLRILEACRARGVSRVVFSSASSLVGTPAVELVGEDHACNPQTPYGVAKLTCEHYLRVYSQLYGLPYLVFRFFNIYGPGQRPESGALVPMLYRKLTTEGKFTVFGDGTAVRDYVLVDDAVKVMRLGIDKAIRNEVLNLGSGSGTSIRDLVELAGKILGISPVIEYQPSRPGEIKNFVADTSRLRGSIGYVPDSPLEVGLRKSFDWLRSNR